MSVLIPLLVTVDTPIRVTNYTQAVFDTIENLSNNSKVLISFEYGPSTKPEVHPMSLALVEHIFRNGHQIYATALWPDGNFMSTQTFNQIAPKLNKKYGEDYVNLGYKPGAEAVIKGIASDISVLYTKDLKDNILSGIPMMKGVKNISNFNLVISLSAGFPGTTEWVQFACDPHNIPLCAGCTSVQVTETLPYLDNGQVNGVLAGMPGAAEYEQMVFKYLNNLKDSKFLNKDVSVEPGKATSRMSAQSVAHLIMVLFIILGNISYYLLRRKNN